jgi:hypothetical protein
MRGRNDRQNRIPRTLHEALKMGFQVQWPMNCRLVYESGEGRGFEHLAHQDGRTIMIPYMLRYGKPVPFSRQKLLSGPSSHRGTCTAACTET